MTTTAALIGLAFLIVVMLNAFTIWVTIHRALRKIIIPALAHHSCEFQRYHWLGFFKTGGFDDGIVISLVSTRGSPKNSIYLDIFYNTGKESKKVTARIDTLFFAIRKVEYSDDF